MKNKLLYSGFVFASILSAADVSVTVDDVARMPEFSGTCGEVVNWALTQKPTIDLNGYAVGGGVSLSQDFKISRRITKEGSFDGAGFKDISAVADCLKSESLAEEIKSKTDQYTQVIRDKTNPLIDHISNTADYQSNKKTSSREMVDTFSFKAESSSSSFFSSFLSEIQSPYRAAQTYALYFFALLAIIGLGGEWIFYKVAKKFGSISTSQTSTTTVFQRFAFGFLMLLIFYSGSPTTRAQDMFAAWIGTGTDLADKLANGAQVANAKYTVANLASSTGPTATDLAKKVKEKVVAEQKALMNAQILQSCSETWRIDELKKYSKSSDMMFSVTPQKLNKSVYEFEAEFVKNKLPYTEEEYSQAAPSSWFTIETCAEAEKAYRNYLTAAPKLDKYFESINNFSPEKVKVVVDKSLQKNITMGWTSIALLPSQQAMQNQKSTIDAQIDKSPWDNSDFKGIDYDLSNAPADVRTIQAIATETGNFSIRPALESMTQRAAFLFVPGTTGMYQVFNKVTEGAIDLVTSGLQIAASTTEAIANGEGWLSKIPFVAEVAGGGATALLKAIQIGRSVISTFVPYYLATEASKIIIESLVYIIPLLVAGAVIAWWYIRVFGWAIASPFIAAAAFSESGKARIINFVIKGFALAFEPMLIVMAVMLAVFGSTMLENITAGMITTQELAMVAHANTVYDQTEWSLLDAPLAGFGAYLASVIQAGLIQGVLFIGLVIVKVGFISTVIAKFPGYVLSLLEVNDGENPGEAISSKINTLTKGL